MSHDLVLKSGRVVDPSQGIDDRIDVAFKGDRVSAVGPGLSGRQERDCTGLIVTPGLIDLHTHVYWGGTSVGVQVDAYARQSAVTTSVDTGSAGPGNFAGFRAHVIERAKARVLAYLNISFAGIYSYHDRGKRGYAPDGRQRGGRGGPGQ